MATLFLDLELEGRAGHELHEWLNGDWALLFSHPGDFDRPAAGRGRWLQDMRYEFNARRAQAIAVKRDGGECATSWIDELQIDREILRLREPPFTAADRISFAARVLRGELLALQSRYVVIVDGALKHRGMLRYSPGRGGVSVFDLLASIDALRRPVEKAA